MPSLSRALERFLLWFGAGVVGGLLTMYSVVLAPSTLHPLLLGSLAFSGILLAAVGLIGMAWEIVRFVNERLLPDPPVTTHHSNDTVAPETRIEVSRPKQDPPSSPVTVSSIAIAPLPLTVMDYGYVKRLFNDHTEAQANRLVEPYLGGRIEVRGEVSDVSDFGSEGQTRVWFFDKPSGMLIAMYFSKEWKQTAAMLRKGSKIAAIGTVWSVAATYISLKDCEFVNRQPSTPRTPKAPNQ
jgi:tRNA_anti-like